MTSRGRSERGPKNQSGARRRIEDGDELWEDHITYTRNYVINVLADLPDSMRSPTGCSEIRTIIGNAMKPYYSDDAGKKPHARAFSTNLAAGD
jgi:hypothetical protein